MAVASVSPSALFIASAGASDAGQAASTAATFLSGALGAGLILSPPHAPHAPFSTARTVSAERAAWVVVLSSQTGAVLHDAPLPVRADPLSGGVVPAVHLLVTVPRYAAAPPLPAGTLALVRAALTELDAGANLAQLADDAEAWVRGVEALTQREPRVAELVRALRTQAAHAPADGASVVAQAHQHLRWLNQR